jgi:1,4-dihydroxy-2-naphthoyl-CoA hydrolase
MSLIDRINANPLPFAQSLGIEFISAEADALAARMLIRPDLCTMGGIAHGGAIMSFADTLGAAAAFINLSADAEGTTTVESKTNFVGSAPAGSTVIGRTTLVHRDERLPKPNRKSLIPVSLPPALSPYARGESAERTAPGAEPGAGFVRDAVIRGACGPCRRGFPAPAELERPSEA